MVQLARFWLTCFVENHTGFALDHEGFPHGTSN
jgi:hypothetical protein